jgi:predicted CopG family antitoxin
MPKKTVSLDLDAYELLRSAKRPGESYSDVIRRSVFCRKGSVTGADLLKYMREGGSGVSEEYLDSVEKASQFDPIPDNPWA